MSTGALSPTMIPGCLEENAGEDIDAEKARQHEEVTSHSPPITVSTAAAPSTGGGARFRALLQALAEEHKLELVQAQQTISALRNQIAAMKGGEAQGTEATPVKPGMMVSPASSMEVRSFKPGTQATVTSSGAVMIKSPRSSAQVVPVKSATSSAEVVPFKPTTMLQAPVPNEKEPPKLRNSATPYSRRSKIHKSRVSRKAPAVAASKAGDPKVILKRDSLVMTKEDSIQKVIVNRGKGVKFVDNSVSVLPSDSAVRFVDPADEADDGYEVMMIKSCLSDRSDGGRGVMVNPAFSDRSDGGKGVSFAGQGSGQGSPSGPAVRFSIANEEIIIPKEWTNNLGKFQEDEDPGDDRQRGHPDPNSTEEDDFKLRPKWLEFNGSRFSNKGKNSQNKVSTHSRLSNKSGTETGNMERTRAIDLINKPKEDIVIKGDTFLQRFVVSPMSSERLIWDFFSFFFLLVDVITVPFYPAFNPERSVFIEVAEWTVLLFWTTDMLTNLFTGYFGKDQVLVLAPSRIATHYFYTWFAPDFIVVGFDWALLVFEMSAKKDESEGVGSLGLERVLRMLRFVRVLRLLRLAKVKRIMQEVHDLIGSEAVAIWFRMSKLIFLMLLSCHIVACVWYGIGDLGHGGIPPGEATWVEVHSMNDFSLQYRYSASLHWALCQLHAGTSELVPVCARERVFSVVVLVLSVIMFSAFISSLTTAVEEISRLNGHETRQFWMLRRFLRDWAVPRHLAIRVQRFAEVAYRMKTTKVQQGDVELLDLLSEGLRDELTFSIVASFLETHVLFNAMSTNMRFFASTMADTIMSQDDIVFIAGQISGKMYFIREGTLEYELGMFGTPPDSPSGTAEDLGEERHDEGPIGIEVKQGTWVSEPCLWTEWTHTGDLLAKAEGEAVTINAKSFAEAAQDHFPVWEQLGKYAAAFVSLLSTLDSVELTDLPDPMNCLSERAYDIAHIVEGPLL